MAIAALERLLAPAPALQSATSPALDGSDPGVSRQFPESASPDAAGAPRQPLAAQSPPLAGDGPADAIVAAIEVAEVGLQSDDPGAPADSPAVAVDEAVAPPAQAAVQPAPEQTPVAAERAPADTETVAQAQTAPVEPVVLAVESANPQMPESGAAPLQLASMGTQMDAGAAASAAGPDYRQWLDEKLELSRQWLGSPERRDLSIQVMMRKKSAARELVYYLRNEWPLDLSQTYIYEVKIDGRPIYRVFYSEFDSMQQARIQIGLLPDSVKVNAPYVHSVRRMRQALL
jgi:hypothetical protein